MKIERSPITSPSMELLYLTYNRLEFTRQSLATLSQNTDWGLLDRVVVYEDGSTDGTKELVTGWSQGLPIPVELRHTNLGGPIAIMNDYIASTAADMFVKLDSDVIVPSGWLTPCYKVMVKEPNLSILGIEPTHSRTASPHKAARGYREPLCSEELTDAREHSVPCQNIGGLGVMRTAAFKQHPGMHPYTTYGGFTTWQTAHKSVRKGWLAPALKLFLLDRIPEEPWLSLSQEYIRRGWQRPWTNYDPAHKPFLWGWWEPISYPEKQFELEVPA